MSIRAREQEKQGNVFKLRGDVEITFRNFVLTADEITYNSDTGEAEASGHVVFEGGPHDEHITATRASYNLRTDSGTFYDVVGSTGVRLHAKRLTLTSSNPFIFTGRVVQKVGRDRFIVNHGSVTSCELPKPKWTFNADKVVFEIGESAKLYHSSFHFFGLPIFYLPYVQHPVERLPRQSGFLLPTIGQSSVKGTIVGDSFYWAINRSLDTTFGAEYYSKRGWAQHGLFRAQPSETSYLNFRYFGVVDRGFGPSHIDQGGEEARLTAEALFHNFRGVADIDYLSSFVFRLAFAETFTQAIDSEVKSVAFLTRNWNGFSANVLAARYQNFQSDQRGDLITIVHAPAFEFSSVDRQIARSPFYWSLDTSAGGVSRREPNFVTANLVTRLDAEPSLSLPLHFHGWSLRGDVGLRNTYYTDRRLPVTGVGLPTDRPVDRRSLDTAIELRPPALTRIFAADLFGYDAFKHTIEPRVTYRYVNGVENFSNIIRFDERDILSDTSEIEYAIVNRFYGRRKVPPAVATRCANVLTRPSGRAPWAPPTAEERAAQQAQQAQQTTTPASNPELFESCSADLASGTREIVAWELAQKYFFDPTFGGALVNGRRNVFTTTADFTGIAFLTAPRLFSPIISRLKVRTATNTDVEWDVDYDTTVGRVNASTALLTYRLGNLFFGGSHAFLHAPGEVFVSQPLPAPEKFNQFRVLAGFGNPAKRGWSAAANVGWDANLHFIQYSAVQTNYNWDCCGVTFEYRRFALGAVRNENQFRFALTLANIGTFGNLRRQERLF